MTELGIYETVDEFVEVQRWSKAADNQEPPGPITVWAVHGGQSRRNYWPITGRTEYPMLFDRECKPKPAFDAVVKI